MIIANNATSRLFTSDYTNQMSKLQTSMSRLASGQRVLTAGDGPADMGISERFRNQVTNSEEAGHVIQNAINLFQSTDAWMQETQNILNRMNELAISSSDGSKNQADRTNLNLEFQQLKNEIARISEAGKYNGLQTNGKTAVAVWDANLKKVKYMQPDGSDIRQVDINMRAGNTSKNGTIYAFEGGTAGAETVGDFIFSGDGKYLVYMAQAANGTTVSAHRTVMRLDVDNNTIRTVQLDFSGGTHANTGSRFVIDEKGRTWVSDANTSDVSTNHNFRIKLLDVDAMSLDSGGSAASNAWIGMSTTSLVISGFSQFAVHDDYLYYFGRSGNTATNTLRYIKQSLFDRTDRTVLIEDVSTLFDLDKGEHYSISQDGQYVAFEDSDNAGGLGQIKILNTFSQQDTTVNVGTNSTSIVSFGFDSNNVFYWSDTGRATDANSVKRAKIRSGDIPEVYDVQSVYQDHMGGLGSIDLAATSTGMGISVGGGSRATRYQFQVGPDEGQTVDFVAADSRLVKLGVSQLSVDTLENAFKAVERIQLAGDRLANQRAVMGAQVSRLTYTFAANDSYKNNIAQAESRIRDVDFAKETTNMTQAQILQQSSISVLSKYNSSRQSVLQLLQ